MEKIEAPKKERRFLKSFGRIGGILLQEFILGLGKKYIGKVINKVHIGKRKELLILTFVSLCSISLFAQYPNTGNKQRLGYQTTGDGLIFRGVVQDTIVKPNNINNAYFLYDTINNVLYSYIKTKGQWLFNNSDTVIVQGATMPFDSLFFKTSVPPNNVDTAKMRWDSEKGTVVLGMYDQVPNELGFKNFWLVKNQTGSTITKGSLVYANGTVGSSGRLTVAKFIANGTIEAKLLLGITAHDLSNGEDGYVISFGKIRQVNTDTFANGAILYPSPTVAGAWTDVEPKAPNIDMPIGFCVNSSSNNGTIAIRVQSGYKMHEIQDVDTTGLNSNEGLVYNGSYFVPSNGKLLTPSDTTSLSSRINLKLNIADTSAMLSNYLRSGVAASTYLTQSNAASTYLPLAGGTVSGTLAVNGLLNSYGKNTYTPFNVGVGEASISNVGNYLRGGTVMIFPDSNLVNSSANLFLANSSIQGVEFSAFGSGLRNYAKQAADNRRNSLALYTSDISAQNTNRLYINYNGDIGINDDTPSYKLDVNGTLGVTGATTLSNLAGSGNRMVIAGSGGLLSTQAIPTGTVTSVTASEPLYSTGGTAPNLRVSNAAADSAGIISLGVQILPGEKSFATHTTFLGRAIFKDYTYTATRLGGLSSTDRFATVTVGSGLSLSSGTLSATATGTVTSVSGTAPISVANGTTTPSITIADASGSVSGVVNTTTQTFAGAKTFSGAITLSSTSGTPTSLLGKNGSNVVNTVTSVNQTGVMATGSVINNTTDTNGYIVISISLSFTPTAVFANIDNVNDYIINVTNYSSIDIAFHIKNVSDGSDANVKTIPKFTWIAVR